MFYLAKNCINFYHSQVNVSVLLLVINFMLTWVERSMDLSQLGGVQPPGLSPGSAPDTFQLRLVCTL